MASQPIGCVLFADVSGSTKLYETMGDAQAHAAVDSCVKLFCSMAERHGGRVVKTIGDEVMAIFPQANRSAQAAVDIQLGLQDMAPVGNIRLGVRIGMHYGPLVERDGDVFGDTVNVAARLTEMAAKGQIITSRETVDLLDPLQKMDSRRLYSIEVKGKEKEVEICELLWSDSDDATTMVAPVNVPALPPRTTLKLSYGGKTFELAGDRRSLTLGRTAGVDVVVADKMASREHCVIERRQDKFVIADRSANGTYVTINGDREIVLRREESMLRGHGYITLGQSRATATEVVEFFCE